jgi:hypothetical protein
LGTIVSIPRQPSNIVPETGGQEGNALQADNQFVTDDAVEIENFLPYACQVG